MTRQDLWKEATQRERLKRNPIAKQEKIIQKSPNQTANLKTTSIKTEH
jgi:hypothetical protein